jgi:hypothetical protein
MSVKLTAKTVGLGCMAVFMLLTNRGLCQQDAPITREQFLLLQEQNRQMQEQMQKQAGVIDSLSHKVSELEEAGAKRGKEADASKEDGGGNFHLGKVVLSGEGGLAFFASQQNGQFPNKEFRVDEARLFIEAPIWNQVYFYSELDLATREEPDLIVRLREIYLDFENLSRLWGGRDGLLTLRAGRFDAPFGEEYQVRSAIDNPLISHSVSDLWGDDEGVMLYGHAGRVQYALAVQNGGVPTTRDFNPDKAVVARVGYDPTDWLHLSVSGMRTGDLDTAGDSLSASWFGGGFFRSLNFGAATKFHANLVEGDVQLRFPWIQLKGAGGYVSYGDNAPIPNTHRDVFYYYVEGVHDFTKKFYGAARFSQVLADGGFPITGGGMMGTYFFSPLLTSNYWRLSMGLGYRFSPGLVVKGEYSFNQGREANGDYRGEENLFALEAAFRF